MSSKNSLNSAIKLIVKGLESIDNRFNTELDISKIEEFAFAFEQQLARSLVGMQINMLNASGEMFQYYCDNTTAFRLLDEKAKNKQSTLENVLVDRGIRITTIENTLLHNIKPDVGEYLEKHCNILYIAEMINEGTLPFVTGTYVDVFKTLFEKAEKIRSLKNMVAVDDEIDNLDIYDRRFELNYIQKKVSNLTISEFVNRLKHFTLFNKQDILAECLKKDISYHDCMYRLITGMSLEKAIQQGLQDKKKYKVCCFDITFDDGRYSHDTRIRDFYSAIIRNIIAEKNND